MNSMEDMMFLVQDLNGLIARYGLRGVKHALNYIDTFPVNPPVPAVKFRFRDNNYYEWDLTEEQFQRVKREYANGLGKISAIKAFREITSCGLKEAKDAIENYTW